MQQCGKILSKYIKIPINNKKHLLLLVYGSNNLMYDMLRKINLNILLIDSYK